MMSVISKYIPLWLIALCAGALFLHVQLMTELNIVEDESAYMQDAGQITWNVLPFREFGGTKGPFWLFILKGWQVVFGSSLEANRFFSSLGHVISIPLLYVFARTLTRSQKVGFIAAVLWAVTAVVVGLTTNVVHIPLELAFILAGATLLVRQPLTWRFVCLAAALFFVAVLTRATAAAFLPLFLVLLIQNTKSWKSVAIFCGAGAALLAVTIAIIYPLYGWPKTAFFFNADATLIASSQRATYAAQEQVPLAQAFFQATLPAWREGLIIMVAALVFPLIWLAQRTHWSISFVILSFISWQLGPIVLADITEWWSPERFSFQWQIARTVTLVILALGAITIWRAKKLPPISGRLMLVLAAWVIAFVGFYKGWGRSPTPFYVLESIPALAIAAAGTSVWGAEGLKVFVPHLRQLLLVVSAAVIVASLYAPYPLMGALQYRGTVEVIAAKTMVTYIEQHVPAGDALFTAQPLFAHMSERPLYGYYTHPGWYLSERAGYLPREIRSVFLPDFDVLTQQVQEEVNWIVVDWRTSDVYFSEKTDDTLPLRTMLKEEFTPLLTVTNESSRDITLYRRTSYTP